MENCKNRQRVIRLPFELILVGGGKVPFRRAKWSPGGGKKQLRITKNGFHNSVDTEIFNLVTILSRI